MAYTNEELSTMVDTINDTLATMTDELQSVVKRSEMLGAVDELEASAAATLSAINILTDRVNTLNNALISQGLEITSLKTESYLQGPTGPIGESGPSRYSTYPNSMIEPDVNWVVASPAPIVGGLFPTVRSMDDTTAQAVGLAYIIPDGATSIKFSFKGKARTAPASAKALQLTLHSRDEGDGAAGGTWDAGTNLNAAPVGPDTYFREFEQTLDLATLGLTVGSSYQLSISRNTGVANNLVGDWLLRYIIVEFI